MAALPPPPSKLPGMIYAAREAENSSWDSLGFSPSMIGSECDRFLWYSLHWAYAPEKFSGRMLRLFETGFNQEDRMIADLKRAGLEVYEVDPDNGKQFTARALAGHVRGKLDGICRGVPEAPAKWHVVECKSHNAKSFKKLLGPGGLKVTKYDHFVQCQTYMHIRGLDRALYIAVNKDTDELHVERVKYDLDFCTRLFARLERILRADSPPPRLAEKEIFACKFCKAKPLCFGDSFARISCRTCVHSSPEFSGDAAWSCARFAKPITISEQREACPAHLYLPDLVPGEMGEVDEERETIAYTLRDGRIWIDGQDRAEAPMANEEVEDE